MAIIGFFEEKRDFIVLALIILNVIGLSWLAASGVEAAAFYMSLFILVPGLIVIFLMFLGPKEEARWLLPIKKNIPQGAQMFVLAMLIVFLLVIFGAGVSKIMQPQFMFSQKMFQPLVLAEARGWQVFLQAFTPAIQEELFFGFIMMSVGIMFGMFVLKITKLDFGKGNKWIYLTFGMIFSLTTFSLWHSFNPVYVGVMFLYAAVFRSVMNAIIWTFGGIEFGISFHFFNNLFTLPLAIIIAGFLTLPGLILLFTLLLIVFAAIVGFREWDFSFGFKRLGE